MVKSECNCDRDTDTGDCTDGIIMEWALVINIGGLIFTESRLVYNKNIRI